MTGGQRAGDSPVTGLVLVTGAALSAAEVRGGWEGGEPLTVARGLSVMSGWVGTDSVGSGEGWVGVKLEEVTEGWVELVGTEGVLARPTLTAA